MIDLTEALMILETEVFAKLLMFLLCIGYKERSVGLKSDVSFEPQVRDMNILILLPMFAKRFITRINLKIIK